MSLRARVGLSLIEARLEEAAISVDPSESARPTQPTEWSESELRAALECMHDFAIFVLDPDGRVRLWTDGAQRVFGYAHDEIIGREFALLFTPEDRAAGIDRKEMLDAATTGRAADERYHERKDGNRFFASGVLSPLHGANGEVTGYVKVASDVSRVKEREEAYRSLGEQLAAGRMHEERMRKLLSRLITVQEEERRRIARELHDHLGQQMTALHLQLELLARQLVNEPVAALERLREVQKLAKQIDQDLHFYTWELRPGTLYNLGLVPALTDFVNAFSSAHQLPVILECVQMPDARLHVDHEINLYRIAQEALNNVHKHARATGADVLLQHVNGRVVLTVHDDGVGFDPDSEHWENEDRGMGLMSMKERAALIHGTLEIEAAPQQGTTIIVSVPAVFRDAAVRH